MQEIGKPKVEYDHDTILRLLNSLKTSQANKDLIKEWDKELFAKGNKVSSRTQYIQSLYRLLQWKPEKDLTKFSRDDLISFKQHMATATYSRNGGKPHKYSPRTIESYLSAAREFYRWQKKPELMDWFKTKRKIEGRLKSEQILSQQEIMKLVMAAGSKRNKAVIFCLWESGCRLNEFLNLKIGNLKIEESYISFSVDGKTGRRTCYIVTSMPTLLDWLEEHPFKDKPGHWLWIKWKGEQMKPQGLQRMLKVVAERAGITKPVFPHALRHSRCTFAANQKMNEMVMRKLYGWSKTSEMPSIYISLSGQDTMNASLEMGGIKSEEKEQPLQPKECNKCKTVNPIDQLYCKECHYPLTVEGAMQLQEQKFEETLEKKIDALLEKKMDEKMKK